MTEVERFRKHVDEAGPGDCWLWTGSRDADGYGSFKLTSGKTVRCHRYAYEAVYGNANGRVILHLCDTPPCVNPRHLRAGTQAENLADRDGKGRAAKGERNGSAVLTDAARVEIEQSWADVETLARRYGVAVSTIRDIRQRARTWQT